MIHWSIISHNVIDRPVLMQEYWVGRRVQWDSVTSNFKINFINKFNICKVTNTFIICTYSKKYRIIRYLQLEHVHLILSPTRERQTSMIPILLYNAGYHRANRLDPTRKMRRMLLGAPKVLLLCYTREPLCFHNGRCYCLWH